MSTSVKTISVRLTKSDVRQIDEMVEYFGETRSEVIKRALILLHYIFFFGEDKK